MSSLSSANSLVARLEVPTAPLTIKPSPSFPLFHPGPTFFMNRRDFLYFPSSSFVFLSWSFCMIVLSPSFFFRDGRVLLGIPGSLSTPLARVPSISRAPAGSDDKARIWASIQRVYCPRIHSESPPFFPQDEKAQGQFIPKRVSTPIEALSSSFFSPCAPSFYFLLKIPRVLDIFIQAHQLDSPSGVEFPPKTTFHWIVQFFIPLRAPFLFLYLYII